MPELAPVYATQYATNVYMMAQQQGSLLYNHVSHIDMRGEKRTIEMVKPYDGTLENMAVGSMYGDTPDKNVEFARRVLSAQSYHWGTMLDWNEEQGMGPIVDPTGPITQTGAYAMGRLLDMIIIQKGLYGPATQFTRANASKKVPGDSTLAGGTEASVAFPAAQKVGVATGGANSGLNLEKLLAARSLLGKSQIPMKAPGQEVVMVIGQSQLDDLLRISQIQSADFNTVKALVAGEVDTFLGFRFVIIDEALLPSVAANDHKTFTCFAFLKSNVVLAEPQPLSTTINTRPDKCNNWQVYAKMKAGATRYEDKGVVHVECYV